MPVFLFIFLCGCATTPYSVPVSETAKRETPGKGIPYYLPHPYLVITKNLTFVTSAEKAASSSTSATTEKQSGSQVFNVKCSNNKEDTDKTKSDQNNCSSVNNAASAKDTYAMQVIYLPDRSQKYALYCHRGTGTYDASVTLVDGWKLSGLNTKSDAKTAEIIQAIGSAAKDVASVAGEILKGGIEEAVKPAAKEEKTTEVVGIWIYDLMGDKPFSPVFKWSRKGKVE